MGDLGTSSVSLHCQGRVVSLYRHHQCSVTTDTQLLINSGTQHFPAQPGNGVWVLVLVLVLVLIVTVIVCLCVRVRVRVRACVCACVCARARVCVDRPVIDYGYLTTRG